MGCIWIRMTEWDVEGERKKKSGVVLSIYIFFYKEMLFFSTIRGLCSEQMDIKWHHFLI